MASTLKITRIGLSVPYEDFTSFCHCSANIHKSDVFEFDGARFCLKFKPERLYDDDMDHFDEYGYPMLYLCVEDFGSRKELRVRGRIWLECDDDRMIRLQEEKEFVFTKKGYDWERYGYEISYLTLEGSEFYSEPDRVTFYCELQHEKREKQAANKMFQKLCVYGDRGIYDCCVINVNGQEYSISKPLLMLHSRVFERMFLHDVEESRSNVINITDLSPDAIQLMISYMNTGRVTHLAQHGEELFVVADKYEIEKLEAKCVDYLVKTVDKKNVFRRLKLAFISNSQSFRKQMLEYITKDTNEGSFHTILQTDEWKHFSLEDGKTSDEIVRAFFSAKE